MRILNSIVYLNFWIALVAFFQCWFYASIANKLVDANALLLVFFATLFAYNFIRIPIFKQVEVLSDKKKWLDENKVGFYLTLIVSFIGMAFCFLSLQDLPIYLLGLPFILVLFYAKSFSSKWNWTFRNIPYFKIVIVALVWTSVCYWFPTLYSSSEISPSYSLAYFLFIFGLTLPFDIRDFDLDKHTNTKTIVHKLGEKKVKVLSILFLIIWSLLYVNEFIPTDYELILHYIFTLLCIFFILKSNKNRHEFYYSFWIDSLLIIQPISYYFLQIIVD